MSLEFCCWLCPNFGPLLDARDSEFNAPRLTERPRPRPRKPPKRVVDCSRPREANSLGPLLDPRPLKPRLDTVLGVDAAVQWFRATRTALSANLANCAASVRVLGALSMTRSRDTSLLSPLTNCLIKMCSSIAGSAALGYARWPISLMSRAKDSILSPASWRRRSSRFLNSSEVSVIAK